MACLLFFSLSSDAIVIPTKMTGFDYSSCRLSTCYYFKGPVGHFSKTGAIFSSEKTKLVVTDRKNNKSESFFCSDFSYEHAIENISCIVGDGKALIDVNMLSNRLSKIKF